MGSLKFRNPEEVDIWTSVFDRAFDAGLVKIKRSDVHIALNDALTTADETLYQYRGRCGHNVYDPEVGIALSSAIRSPDDDEPAPQVGADWQLGEAHRMWLAGKTPQ